MRSLETSTAAEPTPILMAMRRRHLAAVSAIEQVANPRPWSLDLFDSELRQVNSWCVVAVVPYSVVVGFGCVMSSGFEAHVTNLAVDPSWRRRGVARRLLAALSDQAHQWNLDALTLEVRAGNEAAKALYQSAGFVVEGVRSGYYPDGEDALIMWARGPSADPDAGES